MIEKNTRDTGFMKRAAILARNSRCWIGMGCVIARNGKILVEAWNKTLPGEEFCQGFRNRAPAVCSPLPWSTCPPQLSDVGGGPSEKKDNKGCVRHDLGLSQGKEIEKVCSIHAEANAIARAAAAGIKIGGAALFITSFPCLICMRSIIAAGIKKVVYMNDFYTPHHLELFNKNGIAVEQIPEHIVWK